MLFPGTSIGYIVSVMIWHSRSRRLGERQMNYEKNLSRGILIIIIICLLQIGFAQTVSAQQKVDGTRLHPTPFAFSISGGSNSALNPWNNSVVNFHLSLFSGQVKGIQGLQLGAISNHVTGDLVGYDATGIYSRVDGDVAGFQAGGLISHVGGNYIGMQTGGIINRVSGDYFGLQTAGIVNTVHGAFTGLQVGGILNQSNDVRFVQIAGIINQAQDVEGAQIAGISNKAKHVRGVQIGLINQSEKLDGIALGLVNLSESGRVHLVSWGSTIDDFQVGVKFAPNDYWYTTLTAGQSVNSLDQDKLRSFQSHLGFHIPLVAKFYTEIDLGTGNSIPNSWDSWDTYESRHILEARLAIGLRITPYLSVVAGVSEKRISDDQDWWSGSSQETKTFFGVQL